LTKAAKKGVQNLCNYRSQGELCQRSTAAFDTNLARSIASNEEHAIW